MECCPVHSIRYPAYTKLLNRLTYLHQNPLPRACHYICCGRVVDSYCPKVDALISHLGASLTV
jgi:hypothetical protein